MWYVLEDTIPANTSEANKRTTRMKCSAGILHTIYAQIPTGVQGLARFRLRRGSYYILPRNEDKYITGDGVLIEFKEGYELRASENLLTMETWNEDEVHQHKITLLIGVLPEYYVAPAISLGRIITTFMRLFRKR